MLQAWPGDGACRSPDIIARERRWLRPNAEAYRRPDADDPRYGVVRPSNHRGYTGPPAQTRVTGKAARGYLLRRDGAADTTSAEIPQELLRLRAAFAGLRVSVLLLRLSLRGGFNPDQPRVPAGNPDGGQWTATGGVSGRAAGAAGPSGGPAGHHYVTREIYNKYPLRPETREVFQKDTTGPLKAGPHHWSREHAIYNIAVREHFDRFLEQNRISAENMNPEQAKAFSAEIKRSSDPRIRDFNKRIWMREIIYILRRGPRRAE